nr:putative ribonuclease H-like domain-containing protein [Tanacetum cinerariifolium]
MDSLSTPVVSAAKRPILNPNEFDLWKMRIEQYFLMIDYTLWEVILNGDSPVPTIVVDGVVQPVSHKSAEQKVARRNELKACVTPKVSYLNVVKRIFRYLKGKPYLGLWYPKDSPFDLVAYSDSDYAVASLDRKSITGGCQFLGCILISWQCKKQTVVATSSTEAEYVAAASGCTQVLWIQNKLLDYSAASVLFQLLVSTASLF